MARYLLTGACGGMGRAIYAALKDKGDEVIGIDANVPADDGRNIIKSDITDENEIRAAFERVRSEFGSIDGIINAAGIYDLNSLVEICEDDIVRDFGVNLFGAWRINKIFLPMFNNNSRIVIISSELAPLDPLPFTGVYAVTKSALEKYASSLRMELQLLGHSVTVIRPGAVKTGMLPASVEKLDRFCRNTVLYPVNAARFRKIVDRVETRSVPPEKIAATVLRALKTPRPKHVYNINRNPLLILLNALPKRMQLRIIRKILS